MDTLTKEKRSWNMSRIKGAHTKPEIAVRSLLHRMGFRFRLHVKELPGKPDIVLPRWRHIVLVHGCYWHRHSRCKFCYSPKTRVDFWTEKFQTNITRDKASMRQLKRLGWAVTVVWECELRHPEKVVHKLRRNIEKHAPAEP